MKSFRSKPTGWQFESNRHSLAAKGISTGRTYNASKISQLTDSRSYARTGYTKNRWGNHSDKVNEQYKDLKYARDYVGQRSSPTTNEEFEMEKMADDAAEHRRQIFNTSRWERSKKMLEEREHLGLGKRNFNGEFVEHKPDENVLAKWEQLGESMTGKSENSGEDLEAKYVQIRKNLKSHGLTTPGDRMVKEDRDDEEFEYNINNEEDVLMKDSDYRKWKLSGGYEKL